MPLSIWIQNVQQLRTFSIDEAKQIQLKLCSKKVVSELHWKIRKKERTKSSTEGLNFEGIIPCWALEDKFRRDAVSTEVRTKEIEETADHDCTVLVFQRSNRGDFFKI